MDRSAVLALFDEQLRRHLLAPPTGRVDVEELLTVAILPGWAGVTWSGLTTKDADAVIAAQVRRLASLRHPWEWKLYSYDSPPDLDRRLLAAGFRAEPSETLMVAEIDQLDLAVAAVPDVHLVEVTDVAGVLELVHLHDRVFGGDHADLGRALWSDLTADPPRAAALLAVAEGEVIAAGRVEFSAGTNFASLWGGGTLPAWRRRGVFRALVSARAAMARARGATYLQVDAAAPSRPILERLGFVELATTTPYLHPGGSPAPRPSP